MATTEAQRKELWKNLCKSTDDKVRAEHAPMKNDTDFSWHALKGWARNLWDRPTTKYDVANYSMMAGSRSVTFFLSSIPGLGSLLNAAADAFSGMVIRKQMEQELQYNPADHKLAGQLLATSAMQAYVDALRKVEKAATDYNSMGNLDNCENVLEKMARFYYWKYRLQRAYHYHKIATGFCMAAEQALERAGKALKETEKTLDTNMPESVLFKDWEWHTAHCMKQGSTCVFPWKTLEISGPQNVKVNRQAGPREMVRNIPTSAKNPG